MLLCSPLLPGAVGTRWVVPYQQGQQQRSALHVVFVQLGAPVGLLGHAWGAKRSTHMFIGGHWPTLCFQNPGEAVFQHSVHHLSRQDVTQT